MASENYWEQQKAHLLDPELGAQFHFSYEPRELLKGSAMWVLLQNAMKFWVLEMHEAAKRCIAHVYPALRTLLNDQTVCDELRKPSDFRPPSLIFHLETLSVAHWLASGEHDRAVLTRMISEINADPERRPRSLYPPMVNQAILAAIESDDSHLVERYYRKWERRPLRRLPTDLRFASNPRHVLVAHCRYGNEEQAKPVLSEALSRMSSRARNWEKTDAVPFIGIVELARIIFQCERLRGNALSLEQLWPMLR